MHCEPANPQPNIPGALPGSESNITHRGYQYRVHCWSMPLYPFCWSVALSQPRLSGRFGKDGGTEGVSEAQSVIFSIIRGAFRGPLRLSPLEVKNILIFNVKNILKFGHFCTWNVPTGQWAPPPPRLSDFSIRSIRYCPSSSEKSSCCSLSFCARKAQNSTKQ